MKSQEMFQAIGIVHEPGMEMPVLEGNCIKFTDLDQADQFEVWLKNRYYTRFGGRNFRLSKEAAMEIVNMWTTLSVQMTFGSWFVYPWQDSARFLGPFLTKEAAEIAAFYHWGE